MKYDDISGKVVDCKTCDNIINQRAAIEVRQNTRNNSTSTKVKLLTTRTKKDLV